MYQKDVLFFQSVIRFLWDAHNTDEASTSEQVELGVSSAYGVRWEDVSDLWFLGVQVLCALMAQVRGFGREIGVAYICSPVCRCTV